MRALQLLDHRLLKLVELPPPPAPGPGEVTLRIKAVALNHIDVWGWRGMIFAKRKLPLIIGAEASAEVVTLGPGVSSVIPGQIVSLYGAKTCGLCQQCQKGLDNLCSHIEGIYGFHLNGFACEFVTMPARLLVPAPPNVNFIAASLAPITFGTAQHMLFDNAQLQPGETILVHAGGSGIGTAAIQLAKKMGCTVITTVGSDDKIKKAEALGVDHVIHYKKERFEGIVRKLTKKQGVDVVFEHVGSETWSGSMLSLKRGGRLVTCGSTSGVSTTINLMQLFQQQIKIFGSFGCRMENMNSVMQKMSQNIITPVIDTIIHFKDIDAALQRIEERHVFGKIILEME